MSGQTHLPNCQTDRQTDKRTDEPKQTICSARPLKIMPPRVKWLKYSGLQCVHPAYQFQTKKSIEKIVLTYTSYPSKPYHCPGKGKTYKRFMFVNLMNN